MVEVVVCSAINLCLTLPPFRSSVLKPRLNLPLLQTEVPCNRLPKLWRDVLVFGEPGLQLPRLLSCEPHLASTSSGSGHGRVWVAEGSWVKEGNPQGQERPGGNEAPVVGLQVLPEHHAADVSPEAGIHEAVSSVSSSSCSSSSSSAAVRFQETERSFSSSSPSAVEELGPPLRPQVLRRPEVGGGQRGLHQALRGRPVERRLGGLAEANGHRPRHGGGRGVLAVAPPLPVLLLAPPVLLGLRGHAFRRVEGQRRRRVAAVHPLVISLQLDFERPVGVAALREVALAVPFLSPSRGEREIEGLWGRGGRGRGRGPGGGGGGEAKGRLVSWSDRRRRRSLAPVCRAGQNLVDSVPSNHLYGV